VPYTYGPSYANAPRRNGFGIASMVLGIVAVVIPCFWLLQVPGLLATIFGGVALTQLKRDPVKYTGRGMAIAGFVLGIVSLVGLVLLLLFGNLHFNFNSN
jgi:hypothetical protein